jgi:FtsP/CotA-like multicopper oxidase with cupredoxin domain
MNQKSGDGQSNNKRREFIKLGAASLAGTLAACAAPGVMKDADPPPVTPTGDDRGLSESEPVPPEVGDLVDPKTLPSETWQEPWTWRPDDWPGERLELNVVEYLNPNRSPSPGNPNPALFSFNGVNPGPTIRVRNDGELLIRVRNQLARNFGWAPVGPLPNVFDLPDHIDQEICAVAGFPPAEGAEAGQLSCFPPIYPEAFQQVTGHAVRPNWDIQGHINGAHQSHTTNIHTHGLHVYPQTNPDGSHSDNVFLRIIPKDDEIARKAKHGEDAQVLLENEYVGQLDYRYQLSFERNGERMPHPPGTHWYHPHAHGSTHDQVTSGMAGYLIVEGDVDEAVNQHMTGTVQPNPEIPTGPYDYRERLVFLQRAFNQSFDFAAPAKKRNMKFPPFPDPRGPREPEIIRMRPGAVERWRVLNGSVDGAGTKRFMVLRGQFVQRKNRIWRVVTRESAGKLERRLELATELDFENAKANLHQLSLDGITLVREDDGKARHWIKDLSTVNAGTQNPFAPDPRPGETEISAWLRAYDSIWKDGDSIRRAFVRPNELYLTNANRADIFFKAPPDAAGTVYTIFAREAHIHNDNFQQRLQGRAQDPNFVIFRDLFDVVVAYIHITGDPVEGGDFNVQDLTGVLPPVPPLLQPVRDDELSIPADEARTTNVEPGSKRTRTISYSGLGATTLPHTLVPESYARQHPELENLTWCYTGGVPMLLPPLTGTMGINTDFDLAWDSNPRPPRKFVHHDPYCGATRTLSGFLSRADTIFVMSHTRSHEPKASAAMLKILNL